MLMPTRKQIIIYPNPEEHTALTKAAKEAKRSIGNQVLFMLVNGIKLEVKK